MSWSREPLTKSGISAVGPGVSMFHMVGHGQILHKWKCMASPRLPGISGGRPMQSAYHQASFNFNREFFGLLILRLLTVKQNLKCTSILSNTNLFL